MAVFFYDLLRTTRSGRVVLLRTAYALVLLIALYRLHSDRFADTSFAVIGNVEWNSGIAHSKQMAKFAEEFAGLFLIIQMGAVLVLTPAYTAGAIAEERERGTPNCSAYS